ncbi:DNA replication protein DnaC [Caloranaerobacter azorensis DSM 13643]|uniref:DNA replication protein DnaC n=1 Tax=Caloranaerobacter azorensis DSM 13643 TaxID=1121264 RepID=A0A1M5VBB4_9FIRM|nr:ATP-binding protein [Caloranaerobacter azorensis]SHH72496.1 DNA replication protein DnaC [Caloranaerobacter azorensis DSM 13643]
MDNSIINEILREYEKKRDKALYEQKLRQNEVYSKIPKLKEIDKQISKTGLMISKAIINNPENYNDKIKEVKNKLEELKREKAILLTENNIPLEYMNINYECNKCKDTGFLEDGSKCSCFKQALINRAYKMSNLEHILHKENFQTFNINIFSDKPFEDEKMTPRENMQNILSICEGFVFNFDEDNEENLLFYGTTGLGKTFMCNCIAKALLDKGKIVIYQTAFKILEIIEEYRFRRNSGKEQYKLDYELLFDADLLIIDDLGTELVNTFTNTEIFNIVNSRLIKGNKTIISTNLSPMEISNTYTDRIFSRILSKFTPIRFFGPDLRWES